jgi:hypothetical protein
VLLVPLLLVEVEVLLELESVVLPFASVVLWCFLCFFVVVVSPLASVDVVLLVELCVVSELPVLPDCAASLLLLALPDCAASLCGIVLELLFIESLLEELCFWESLLVLCAASPLVDAPWLLSEGLWFAASAGLVGVLACDISFGVVDELSSDFGVVLSDCGVVEVSGVVVVVVLEFVVVLLVPPCL